MNRHPTMTTATIRLVLVCGVVLAIFSFGGSELLAQAGGAAGGATPAGEVDQPGKLTILARLILGHIDFVTVTIFLLSIVAMTFIIRGFMQARQDVVVPDATVARIREMITSRQYQELLDFTETDTTFVGRAINPALKRAPQYTAMKEAMEISIGEQTADAFRRIEILNIIGNLGPLLGLLGTVLGMIEAFDAMQRAGTTDPSKLAGGIATALAHTFLGLFLAIPTLAAFGILRTMNDRLTTKAAIVSEDLLSMMKPGESRTTVAPAAPVVTPPRPQPVTR